MRIDPLIDPDYNFFPVTPFGPVACGMTMNPRAAMCRTRIAYRTLCRMGNGVLLLALLPTLMVGPMSGKTLLAHAHGDEHVHLHVFAAKGHDEPPHEAQPLHEHDHRVHHDAAPDPLQLTETEDLFLITLTEVVALRPVHRLVSVDPVHEPVWRFAPPAEVIRTSHVRLHAGSASDNGSRDGPPSDRIAAILSSNHALLL